MPNIVYIATSLDGYIADRDGGVEWLQEIPNPEASDCGFAEFMAGVDAVVMGRVTYETVLGFDCEWPYSKPVIVLSRTLTAVPEELSGKVEFLSGPPADVVAHLRGRGFERLYVDGGRTIHGFLGADLIDELIVSTLPILLGGGTPLFDALPGRLTFEHVRTEVLLDAIVKSHYRRGR